MSVAELQKYTAVSKYARYLPDQKRREVWSETAARYRGMLIEKYPEREALIRQETAYIDTMEVMPSMRGLQFGGKPIFQHNSRLYNCVSAACDRTRFFVEGFYLLLSGCGVGFSVQERHVRSLPRFSQKRLSGAVLPAKTFRPSDSIEGWADCAATLLSSFLETPLRGFEEYHDCEVDFDLTGIRKEKAPLSFGVGVAPGPKPLAKALGKVRRLLLICLASGQERLRPIDAYDLFMFLADAVVSGGVRRSATICLFDPWDQDMLLAKTGDWRQKHPQRGRSNNSGVFVRSETLWEDFQHIFAATRQFGEPGFFFCDDPDEVPNPCLEIGMWPFLKLHSKDPCLPSLLKAYEGPVRQGIDHVVLSGFQMCNLTTINGKLCRDPDDFVRKAEAAARLGTWQAGFTSFPYAGEVTERIVRKEALLGVSISGIMHHPDFLLDPATLERAAKAVLDTNEHEAARIGINPCARATCIKPDGNSASAMGTFPGAHGGKLRRGFRIAQVNRNEAPYQHFRSVNPQACEKSVWSANGTDDVIRFCLELDGKLESDMTALEFLGHIRTLQKHWVQAGKRPERCSIPSLCHNVSNTVRVQEWEWDQVARDIYEHRQEHVGVSFIGAYGDRDYAQAPFTACYDPEEQRAAYGPEAPGEGLHLANRAVEVFAVPDTPSAGLWTACDVALGLATLENPSREQKDWLACFRDLARRYFEGDERRATYCLKDAWSWQLYEQLKASYQPVDWAGMREDSCGVTLQQEVACAGGACQS